METLGQIRRRGKAWAGVLLFFLILESEGAYFSVAWAGMVKMTNEQMSGVFFFVSPSDFLALNRFDFGCEFNGDFECWKRIAFPINDVGGFIPLPQKPIKYNLIITSPQGTGRFVIPPREIRRGSIVHYYNRDTMGYEFVWHER
jgi:hypothetical protein